MWIFWPFYSHLLINPHLFGLNKHTQVSLTRCVKVNIVDLALICLWSNQICQTDDIITAQTKRCKHGGHCKWLLNGEVNLQHIKKRGGGATHFLCPNTALLRTQMDASGLRPVVLLFTGGWKWTSSFPPPSAWTWRQRGRLSSPSRKVRGTRLPTSTANAPWRNNNNAPPVWLALCLDCGPPLFETG